MPEAPPQWFTPDTAKAQLNIVVTEMGLTIAKQEILRSVGLAIDTERPPSVSFAAGVVYQALANKQAASANSDDEMGGQNTVRLWPFDKRIMAMLIIPDATDDGRDLGRVRSLIG